MDTELQPEPAAAEHSGIPLDPFGYVPTQISRIIGLGGGEPGFDPYYAFHTPYVDCGEGPILFAVQFHSLVAKRGTLTLRIHSWSQEPHAGPSVVDLSQHSLRDLAVTSEPIILRLVAKAGTVYAIFATIYDETDARAEGLTVTLDERGDMSPNASKLAEARRSAFGEPSIRPVAHLVSGDPATLADPVSQMSTLAQLGEPAFAEWLDRLPLAGCAPRKQWESVYILQALRRYGMLLPGARGVGFGVGAEPMVATMATMGCAIVATDRPSAEDPASDAATGHPDGAALDALRRPEICTDDEFAKLVSYRPVDMTEIPADLEGFDFAWSAGAIEHLGSLAAAVQFVEDSVRCLKPGGVAVHTTELNLSASGPRPDAGEPVLFRRSDVERVTLSLISRGHEVAQIKFDSGDPIVDQVDLASEASGDPAGASSGQYPVTSFGLIVRRGLSG